MFFEGSMVSSNNMTAGGLKRKQMIADSLHAPLAKQSLSREPCAMMHVLEHASIRMTRDNERGRLLDSGLPPLGFHGLDLWRSLLASWLLTAALVHPKATSEIAGRCGEIWSGFNLLRAYCD